MTKSFFPEIWLSLGLISMELCFYGTLFLRDFVSEGLCFCGALFLWGLAPLNQSPHLLLLASGVGEVPLADGSSSPSF
ncbi:hypothetical protein [Kiloniella majae]|uniref:hypothetical protein n=1 Tax=Kiloniella majae TaxID=1938558 RepID=UPI000A278D9D|nr:hypothetical protein [Kiloniella majae]